MTKRMQVMKDLHQEYTVEAQAMHDRAMRVVLDTTEMCSEWFIACEDAGEVVMDSLGFLWFPMNDAQVIARDTAIAQLNRIWIDA